MLIGKKKTVKNRCWLYKVNFVLQSTEIGQGIFSFDIMLFVDPFLLGSEQWRTQKLFVVMVSISGIWWTFVFGVRCFWRHNLTSHSCFQTNVLAKLVDIICIFFYTHSPYFVSLHWIHSKVSALQDGISEEIPLNATTQQFKTAKISGRVLKQGSDTLIIASIYNYKWGCANVLSNTSSRAWKICGWTGWSTSRFARSILGKLPKNWECTQSTQENFRFFVMHRRPTKVWFSFFSAKTLSNARLLLC